MVVDVQGRAAAGAVRAPAPATTATTSAWRSVTAVPAATTATTPRRTLKVSINFEEDLLFLLSTRLGSVLGLSNIAMSG